MRISERQLEMPGVQISVDSTRRYVDGPLVAHLMGYMGAISAEDADRLQEEGYRLDDHLGAAGIEQWYEKDLRGTPGRRMYQVEVTGQEVGELRREDAQPGLNLVLTLDLELQRDVMRILQEGLRNSPAGAAIVMDPRNGEILAMVSTPTFDANIIGDPNREDELQQLLNDSQLTPMFPRAFEGQYPPGSVFKLVTGSAALQEGVANRDTVIESRGEMYVERDDYPGVRPPVQTTPRTDRRRSYRASPTRPTSTSSGLAAASRKPTASASTASASTTWPATHAASVWQAHRPRRPRRAGRHDSRSHLEAAAPRAALVQRRHLQHEHRPGRRAGNPAAGRQRHECHRQRRDAVSAAPGARLPRW